MSIWRIASHLVPVVAIAGALLTAYYFGVSVTTDDYEALISKLEADAAAAQVYAVNEARRQEQSAAAYISLIDHAQEETLRNAIQARDDTIDDLRAGNLQLRERFTCPASASGVPSTTSGAGLNHETRKGGLQRTDAEFLVRFAADADEVAIQLQGCQAVLGLFISTPPSKRTQEVAP